MYYSGHIRRWIHHKEREMVIYDIGENRWCGNVNRQHKSNHIYYMADLQLAQVYQKCHDFECSNYRSEGTLIPPEVNPLYNGDGTIDEFGDTILDDKMLNEDMKVAGNKENTVQNQSESHNPSEFENLSDYFDNDDSFDECVLFDTETSSKNALSSRSPADDSNHLSVDNNDCSVDNNDCSVDNHDFSVGLFNYANGDSDGEIFLDKSLPLKTGDHKNRKIENKNSGNMRNNSFDLFEDSELYTQTNNKISENSKTNRCNPPDSLIHPKDKHQGHSYSEIEPHAKKQKILNNINNEQRFGVKIFTLSQETQLNDFFKDDFIFNEL